MESRRVVLQLISGLPAIIVGLAAVVFPDYGLPFLVAAVLLLVIAILAWGYLSFKTLKAENIRLKEALARQQRDASGSDEPPRLPPVPGSNWRLIEEVDLLLDGFWDRTKTFHCAGMTSLKTTVAGRNRFIVHLVDSISTSGPRRKWKYNSVEDTAETTKITRTWEVLEEGNYAFVVEPVGAAPFHVTVRVERLDKASMAVGTW